MKLKKHSVSRQRSEMLKPKGKKLKSSNVKWKLNGFNLWYARFESVVWFSNSHFSLLKKQYKKLSYKSILEWQSLCVALGRVQWLKLEQRESVGIWVSSLKKQIHPSCFPYWHLRCAQHRMRAWSISHIKKSYDKMCYFGFSCFEILFLDISEHINIHECKSNIITII